MSEETPILKDQPSIVSRIGGALGSVASGAVAVVGAATSAAVGSTSDLARYVTGSKQDFSNLAFTSIVPTTLPPDYKVGLKARRYRTNTIIKDGIVEKWTNYVCSWKPRYFILEPGILKYANAPGQSIKETFPLCLCKTQAVPNDPLRIELEHPHGILHLRMSDPSERKLWIDAILKAKNTFQQHAQSLLGVPSSQNSKKVIESQIPSVENISENFEPYDISTLFENEKYPMRMLSDACTVCRQSINGCVTEINKLQTSLIQIAGQVKDNSFRNEVKTTLVRIVELLDYLQLIMNRQLSTTEVIIQDEECQIKALQHHIRVLAKRNYNMQSNLKNLQNVLAISRGKSLDKSLLSDSNEWSLRIMKAATLIKNIEVNESSTSESVKDDEEADSYYVTDGEGDLENEFYDIEENNVMSTQIDSKGIERRTELPRSQSDIKKSLWKTLKHCIGKDLSRISLPVYFNEPTSFLQRLAEDFQYTSLLTQAASFSDSCKRLAYVTCFIISPSASTVGRTYKPFNPLLGETFELTHRGFAFIAEQVSHHPPITAYHVSNNLFTAWGYSQSIEISVPGYAHIVLQHQEANITKPDHYCYQRPKAVVNNVIFGELALSMIGSVIITNSTTGDFSYIEYIRQGWWSSDTWQVQALVFDSEGYPKYFLGGQWNKEIWMKELPPKYSFNKQVPAHQVIYKPLEPILPFDPEETPEHCKNYPHCVTASKPTGPPIYNARCPMEVSIDWAHFHSDESGRQIIWQPDPRLPEASKYYQFSQFTVELNDLSLDYDVKRGAIIPRTDSRYRPDQRFLEYAEIDKSSQEKTRLEEKQRYEYIFDQVISHNRAAKKLRDSQKIMYKPRWFYPGRDIILHHAAWLFTGEYWEEKKKGHFTNIPDIFS